MGAFSFRKMKTQFLILYILVALGVITSCELQEEKITTSSSVNLLFSTDTVLFDTLLTTTSKGSITKRLRIYNPSKNAVSISSIRLGKGDESEYSLIINGRESNELQDEVVFGGDSLMILVSVTIDPKNEDLPYIVKDSILVEWNGKRTHVKLAAWGQDAIYLNQEVICDQLWTADRPYVIYSNALIDLNCTLTVEPGTRIYIENESSLWVGGTLKILGDSANPVLIRNTRFDENYKDAPGQWGEILFGKDSKGNQIDYAIIENGTIGLQIGSPDEDTIFDLTVSHTIIRNMAYYGILSFESDIHAYNTLIYNCGEALLVNNLGGYYKYEHCTFTGWPNIMQSDNPAIYLNDFFKNPETNQIELVSDLNFEMKNCIVWGTKEDEIVIEVTGQTNVVLELNSNIIRSSESIAGNITSEADNFPGFANPFLFDFSLDSLSNARDEGIDSEITDDLLGKPRGSMPDIGAYEWIDLN